MRAVKLSGSKLAFFLVNAAMNVGPRTDKWCGSRNTISSTLYSAGFPATTAKVPQSYWLDADILKCLYAFTFDLHAPVPPYFPQHYMCSYD
jgi:hypothetical protein